MTRISAPSSSRMLLEIFEAMYSRTSGGATRRSWIALLAEDGDAGLEVGRLDVGDQAPLEPRAHAILEVRQLLGRQVGGDDDLLVGVVESVEGVEELFLRLDFSAQELDVVDEQDVDVAVAALEAGRLVVADAVDELVGELLRADVPDARALVEGAGVVADRVQQVGLAQSGAAVDEQRVVGAGRLLGDGDGRGVREAVARADDEGLEGVLVVEPAVLAAGAGRAGAGAGTVVRGRGRGPGARRPASA